MSSPTASAARTRPWRGSRAPRPRTRGTAGTGPTTGAPRRPAASDCAVAAARLDDRHGLGLPDAVRDAYGDPPAVLLARLEVADADAT
jgi:hypothetical protein